MNRAYFAGNYYIGNNGTGRTNLIKSPVPIPGVWANYCGSARSTNKGWFLIDAAGMVFFIGFDASTLGNGATNTGLPYTVPTSIARPGSYKMVDVTGSSLTSVFLDGSDGSIWVSGSAASGSLGNNTATAVSSPVTIARPGSYFKVVGGVSANIAAIDGSNGSIWTWGLGTSGQLGDNTATTKSSPVSVKRPGSYSDVSVGNSVTLMIDGSNGSVWSTGLGTSGQLGDNTATTKSSPVSLARPGSYSKVYAGRDICFAIEASTGMIYGWGSNGTLGLLGVNNTTAGYSSPIAIARPGSYKDIACKGLSTWAIDGSDGSLWAWGVNYFGQLCDGTTISRTSPISVLGGRSYSSIKCGDDSFCAMTADGTVYVAGYDAANQLGRQVPFYTQTIIPILSSIPFSKIYNNIFLDTLGNIYCTGPNGNGSLGDNTNTDSDSLVSIARPGSYKDIASVYYSSQDSNVTCAAIDGSTGMIYTWGYNNQGQLGDSTTSTSRSSPISISRSSSYSMVSGGGLGTNFMAIDASSGMIWGWGLNSAGQLGDNTTTGKSSPVSIRRPGSYSSVLAGTSSYFIDATTGNIWACGTNSFGQLGDGSILTRSSPVAIQRAASYSKVMIAAAGSTYAIDASDGSVWAWGYNGSGQLGDGTITNKSSPISMLGGRSYIDIAAGAQTVYLLTSGGVVYAAGYNQSGQFGDNTTINASSPISLPFSNVLAIHRTPSANLILIIDATVPAVDTQPSNAVKVQGETAQFTVVAHGNPSL